MGLDHTLELPALLIQASATEVFNFFSPARLCDSYVISSLSLLYPSVLKTPYEIVTTGTFSVYSNVTKTTDVVPVVRPLIMTTHAKDKIPSYFMEKIDHVVELGEYTEQQLELIVLQRLRYCNVDCAQEEEKVLQLIVEYGSKDLPRIISLLKNSFTIMLADGRTILAMDDVEKAATYS